MEILFILLVAFIFAVLTNFATDNKSLHKKVYCKLHVWVYDIQGYLFCKECNVRPGEVPTSYDKPY